MDRTDLRIFSRLVTDALRSDEAIGRDVGLTGKAVRTRRQRLEAAGVLSEYGIHPAAEILGRHARTWRFVGRDAPGLPVSRLAEIEDLAYVLRFRPNLHVAVRFTKEPDPPADPNLSRILGRPIEGPPDGRPSASSISADELSRADWKVLEAVVRSPRASYSIKAKQADVSARTFRLHQSKMEATGALECVMILNLEREAGLATYGIWLKVDDSFDEKALELPRLWDRPHWTQNPRGVFLLGSAESYFEAREVELRLRALPGVVGADPLIPAGGFFARERFLKWIRAERDRFFPSPGPNS
ncbi:MAG TPA: Lrp/AsnC family transcriptional regulator [Thermoplasmata archaeon]|nr:Lrp/AsnC family transcriptional regulator [Thermoplasmata archaeon]